jgi:hypothetical protein
MRPLKTILCALAVTAIAPSIASAQVLTVGDPKPAYFPSCPSVCHVMPRATGYQVRVGTNKSVDTVQKAGSIVAWTLQLGKPGKTQTQFFINTVLLSPTPQARLTVLKPVGKQKLHYVVAGQSPTMTLTPYLGFTVQFPLPAPIEVHKNYVIALTTPTWAPVLSETGRGDTSWRNSRAKNNCQPKTYPLPDSSLAMGNSGVFGCLFTHERITFNATEITKPGTPVITTPRPTTTTTTTTTTGTDTVPTDTTSTSTTTSTTTTTKPKT